MRTIPEQEIRQFYKEYKETVHRQDDYESILYFLYMKPEQREKWFLLLNEKSAFQTRAFQENEKKIAKTIQPFLQEGENHAELTRETADTFLDEIIQMSRQCIFDSLLTIEILKKLISFYTHAGDTKKQILCWFYLAYFYNYMNNTQLRQESLLCYEKVVSYQNQYDTRDTDIQKIMVAAFYNRTSWDEQWDEQFCPTHFQHLLEAYEFCIPKEMKVLSNPGFEVDAVCRYLENQICRELLKPGGEAGRDSRINKLEQEYYRRLEVHGQESRLSSCEFYNWWKRKCKLGLIEDKEYCERLYEYYKEEPWEKLKTSEECNFSNLVQMMPLFQPELFRGAVQYHPEWMAGLKENVCWYYTGFPRNGNKAYVDRLITNDIMQVIAYYSKEEVMDLYEKVLLIRQSATEIHIRGVAKLVKEIAEPMITRHPEYGIGILGITTAKEAYLRKEEILDFLQQCAMQHDRGKVFISTTVNMQLRKLTELEWQAIKMHTTYGLEGGEQYTGLKKYYNVILGHHKYYNGKGGYPEEFDNVSCPDKFAIDLITICDCLDAATDALGRNYTNSKTVVQVLQELEEGSGSKYSPEIVEFIKSEPGLLKCLEEITSKGREETYYKAYHLFAVEKEEKSPR